MNHFCEQCGAQLREGALFCGKCGASTELQNKQIQRKKTGKKAVIISSVAVVAILVFAVTVAYLGSDRFQCKKMMRRAQESCEAEEYEDARTILRDGMQKLKDEASTQMLNDKLAEVYLAEADTCLEKEEYLSALRTVVDGRKETRSEVLTEREEYLRGHFVIVNEKEFWDDESATEHVYDKYGNEVKTVHYNSDGVIEGEEKTDSEYDEYGNVKKSTTYGADGSIEYWGEGECDKSGNWIKWVLYDGDSGRMLKWREFEYDDSGNVVKKIWRMDDGSVGSWYGYEYDESGNLTKWTSDDGVIYADEYDEFGKMIKHMDYNHLTGFDGDEARYWSVTDYEYNEFGNMIKEIHSYSNGVTVGWDEYKYDEFGNLIKKVYYGEDGESNRWDEYEYDETGNQTERKYRSSDGKKEILEEYKRDIMGNIISYRDYGDNGFTSHEYEYQYTYIDEKTRRKRDVLSQMW